jgi:hypothetical protein
MIEFFSAAEQLSADLRSAGVASTLAESTVCRYLEALTARSDEAWRAFYASVYRRLSELAAGPMPYAGPRAAPLIALIEDDFGVELFSPLERARIRAALVERGMREASLPS